MKTPFSLSSSRYDGPLGQMLLSASDQGLAGAWFMGQKHFRAPPAELESKVARGILEDAARQLAEYFSGARKRFDLPLDLRAGTAFQQRVWHKLLGIEHGRLSAYGEIAKAVGSPLAARAVGAAVGRNPISIIVPCHRVVGANASLTGYAAGLDRKVALLQLEGAML